MPGWVLPAVAAELWGVTIEQVMADVAAGRVTSRVEGEFIFVDVQPAADESEHASAPTPSPYRRSLAWSVPSDATTESITADPIVSAEERDALLDEPAVVESSDDDAWADAEDDRADDVDAESEVDAPDGPIVLTADDIPNWGEVRSRVGRSRRPPRRILDAA